MDKQYGLSPEEVQLLKDQAARRLVMRNEFLKQTSNPHNYLPQEGYVFDKALQRYMSMTFTQYQFFRPTPKNSIWGLCLSVIPISLFGYAMWYERSTREKKYRTGQVAYRDRDFKLK